MILPHDGVGYCSVQVIECLFEVSCAVELSSEVCRCTDAVPVLVSAVLLSGCDVTFAQHVFGKVSSIERRGAVGLAGKLTRVGGARKDTTGGHGTRPWMPVYPTVTLAQHEGGAAVGRKFVSAGWKVNEWFVSGPWVRRTSPAISVCRRVPRPSVVWSLSPH